MANQDGVCPLEIAAQVSHQKGTGLSVGRFVVEILFQPGFQSGQEVLGRGNEFRIMPKPVDGGMQDNFFRVGGIAGGHGPGQGVGAVRHGKTYTAHNLFPPEVETSPVSEINDPAQFLRCIHSLNLLAQEGQAVDGHSGPDFLLGCQNVGELEKFHDILKFSLLDNNK